MAKTFFSGGGPMVKITIFHQKHIFFMTTTPE